MTWDTKAIRQLLSAAFSDEELTTLCFDRFRAVYEEFSSGMSKGAKIQQLVEYCDRQDQLEALAQQIQKRNPAQYNKFAAQLQKPSDKAQGLVARGDSEPKPVAPSAPPGPIRNRWALLVGVNRYTDPAFPSLNFCVNDVLALEAKFKALGYTVVALHDAAQEQWLYPTRENIEAELVRLCQVVQRDDLLLAHFACHGKLVEGKPALVTCETRAPTLAQRALPLAEVERQMRASQARRLVLTLDACHTGVEIGRDLADPEFIHNACELAEGFALIAASTSQQVAQEWAEKQHGVFTYFLLDGLSGKADRAGKGMVTVDDLKTHILDGLRRWNVEHGGLLQEPTARAEGMGDIILADYRQPVERAGNPAPRLDAPNPFTDTVAVRQAGRFVGRQAELRRLQTMLQGGSVALLGQPKIGKSSLLWQLANTWSGKVIGPLDCLALSDQDDFYQCLAKALGLGANDWRAMRNALGQTPALFLLDELDAGPGCGLTHTDLARFRAACSSNPGLRLVTVSRVPLKAVFPDPGQGSPAYNFLQPFTLGPLAQAEALELLAHPWAQGAPLFDAATCGELLALAGCHPFKLQRAAFHRYETLSDPAYDWQAAYNQDIEQML